MSRQADLKDTPSLLLTAFRQFADLMLDEVALAKAEVSRNVRRAGTGLVLIGIATMFALVALNVLAETLIAYLAATSLSLGTAALIVAGILMVFAAILVIIGRRRLSADGIMPDRTARNVSTDLDIMKEATHA